MILLIKSLTNKFLVQNKTLSTIFEISFKVLYDNKPTL
jgi:hypothetical protein